MISIYIITHIESQRHYVGQTNNLKRRWAKHKKDSCNAYLRNAMVLYKPEAFSLEVIEEVETREEANIAEMFWIALLKKCNQKLYNLSDGGENPPTLRGKDHPMWGRTGNKNPMFGRTGSKNPMFGKIGDKAPNYGLVPTNAKLTKVIANSIREEYATGLYDYKDLGLKYEVSQSTIGKIIRGERYKCSPLPQVSIGGA